MTHQNLLVELFVEELPPKALKKLGDVFASQLCAQLRQLGLASSDSVATPFASPRRLAAHITHVAAKAADTLVTVGPRAKFIAEGAKAAGMSKKKVASFDSADEARVPVQDLLRKGDIVLLKASRAIGLDKIVEEIRQF